MLKRFIWKEHSLIGSDVVFICSIPQCASLVQIDTCIFFHRMDMINHNMPVACLDEDGFIVTIYLLLLKTFINFFLLARAHRHPI